MILFLALLLKLASFSASATGHELMPAPKHVKLESKKIQAPKNITFYSNLKDVRLQSAVERLSAFWGVPIAASDPSEAFIRLRVTQKKQRSLLEKEEYALEISAEGVVISASNVLGVLRGVETLKQLGEIENQSVAIPLGEINDMPRFSWRGLLLDVSRHFFSVEAIKRQLEAMAQVKMNVLHLHLSDDQGFRVESKRYPLLQLLGSNGLYYTQKQIKELINHAWLRGIRIVPEFDVPGHVTSWLVAYPHLASLPKNYVLSKVYGIHDAAMDPTKEETYLFLEEFFQEMAQLFPDRHMHIGGDEVTGKHWNSNPEIKEFMLQNGHQSHRDLQDYFTKRLSAIIEGLGKKSLAWDEVINGKAAPEVNIQVWRHPRYLKKAAREGRQIVFSYGYYLDHQLSSRTHYQIDPLEGAGLSEAQEKLVLGGEACMWTERVNESLLDSRVWPRSAAIAERLWSTSSTKNGDDMQRRLQVQSARLEKLGLDHRNTLKKGLLRLSRLGASLPALSALAEILEPGKFYSQHAYREFKVDTKLDRLADFLPSHNSEAFELNRLVDKWLADKDEKTYKALYEKFNGWRQIHANLKRDLGEDERLQELLPLAKNLFTLSWVSQEALSYKKSGKDPGALWVQMNLHRLERAAEMRAGCELALAPAVKKLILSLQ